MNPNDATSAVIRCTSPDGVTLTRSIALGGDYRMRFDYRKLFMGTKFAIFNYSTKQSGGYVDVDWFHYQHEAE